MRRHSYALLVASALTCGGIALAAHAEERTPQHPPQNQQLRPEVPNNPASGSSNQPGAGPPGSLSNDLSKSQGVLQPPPTADGGVITPPSRGAGNTPVIPPPGTPGGNPQVQPK